MIHKLLMAWGLALLAFTFTTDAHAMLGTATAVKINETTIRIDLAPIDTGGFPTIVNIFRNSTYVEQRDYPSGTNNIFIFSLQQGNYHFFVEWCGHVTSECAEARDTTNTVTLAGPPMPPPPPATVQCSNCTVNSSPYLDYDGTYNITWSNVSGALSYEIQASPVVDNVATGYVDIPNGTISNNPTGHYRYRVKSCNANGCSTTWTQIDRDVQVLGPPPPPINPIISHNFATITVSWTAPPSGVVVDYNITDLRPDGTGGTQTVTSAGTTYPVTQLGLHSYSVRACNAAGCSSTPLNMSVDVQLSNCNVTTGSYAVQACAVTRNRELIEAATRQGGQSEADFAIALADGLYDIGAAFLCDDNDNIHRLGLLDRTDPNVFESLVGLVNGLPTFDADALGAAEAYYQCALNADPGNAIALEGILSVKRALVEKENLVADVRRKDQFVSRYEVAAPDFSNQTVLVQQEINILEDASADLRDAVSTILALYAQPGPNSAGALLRGEISIGGSTAVRDTIRALLTTITRFAQVEQDLGRARIDRNFYNENTSSGRPAVVEDLDDAAAYLTLVLQLVNPFISETTFDLPEPNELNSSVDELLNQSGLLDANAGLTKLGELSTLLHQGYNPFGFVPDFVPFVQAASQESNLHTFNQMHGNAVGAIDDLQSSEATICGACNGTGGGLLTQIRNFATSEGEFEIRMNALTTTYQQRLKTLVGDVTIPGGQDKVADIYTFLYPDTDLDGDGVTERDAKRAELTGAGYNFLPENKGQISAQYNIIANAQTRADDVLDQMEDLVERMELVEAEARELAELDASVAEDIFLRVTADGDQISLLIKQRGYIQQAAADREARKRKRLGIFGSFVNLAASIVTGNAAGIVGAASNAVVSLIASSTSGSAASQTGVIDAQINDITTLQQADITVIAAAAHAEERLIKAGYTMYNLALSQNNLALSYMVAQRDADRELNALSQQTSEVATLLTDLARTQALLQQNNDNQTVGWANVGVRDTLTDSILVADKALLRAKVWSYVALRALDYYAILPPNPSTGQPAAVLLDLYQRLYFARRSEELEYVVNRMQTLANTDFLFSSSTVSCGQRTLLSLKNDIYSTNSITYDPITGDELSNGDTSVFEYFSVHDGMTYEGADARQALFRDELRRNISLDANENRVLTLRFATNLFPPVPEQSGFKSSNPYYSLDAKGAKIIGFENSNCGGIGIPNNIQGIQVNFNATGFAVPAPSIWIFQEGNSYLKHTAWDASDFNSDNQLLKPMENLTIFTAYTQILPSWLIGDIGSSIIEEKTIGSAVNDTIYPLINLQGGGGTAKTLAFSDRSVANDSWRLVIRELDANNDEFFDQLELMLTAPVDSTQGRFLKDIELLIGWASRNN